MAKDRFRRLVQDMRMAKQGREGRSQQKGVAQLLAQIEQGRKAEEAAAEAKARKERNKAMGLKLLEKRKCSPSS